MTRVAVKPELLRWAWERAGLDPDGLARHFPSTADVGLRFANPTYKNLTPLGIAPRQ